MKRVFRKRRLLAVMVGLAMALATIVLVRTSAQAALPNPQVDSDGPLASNQTIFANFAVDFFGGDICIVSADVTSVGTTDTCDKKKAWGTPKYFGEIGTQAGVPIQSPPLRPGTWRLMTAESEGGSGYVSDPFEIVPCDPAQGCENRITVGHSQAAKDAARLMAAKAGVVCAGANGMKNLADDPKIISKTMDVERAEGVLYTGALFAVGHAITGVADKVKLLAVLGGPLVALDVLKSVLCRTGKTYQAIADDPPDPNFGTVYAPEFSTFPKFDDQLLGAEAVSADRQDAFAKAMLVAYERYQGAIAAGNSAGEIMQAAAIAEYGQDLSKEMTATADAMDSYANEVAADPVANAPTFTDQADKDQTQKILERVRDSGFDADEIADLKSIGFTTDAQLAAARSTFYVDVSEVPVNTAPADLMHQAADTMREQSEVFDEFSNAGAVAEGTGVPAADNQAPVAAFTSKVPSAAEPHEIAFDASGSTDSDGTVTGYAWDFGDGTKGDGAFPVHEYAKAGTYTVTLTVTDDDGASNSKNAPVVVQRNAPTAVIAAQPDVLTVHLDGTGSVAEGSIASYAWDFGDGSSGSGAQVDHTYGAAGAYTVTLTVTDDAGGQATAKSSVTVVAAPPVNVPPQASFTSSAKDPQEPHEISFDASGSTDADGTITGYAWDFGDGTKGTGVSPVHEYAKAGTYTVSLTVTDDDGATGAQSAEVDVKRLPPSAGFTAKVDDSSPLTVHFDGTKSGASEGSITAYDWDFGDGESGTGTKPDHTYAAPGTYKVTLAVTDDSGMKAMAQSDVTVSAGPPPNQPPTASFTVKGEAVAPADLTFDASGSSDPDGTVASYSWSFGDGAKATGKAVQHTFTEPGTYSVALTVTDDDEASTTSTISVVVSKAETQGAMCDGHPATIVGQGEALIMGTRRDDVIVGTSAAEEIHGGGGNDIICAGGGDDLVFADNGKDTVFGGTGNDTISGGDGTDALHGGDGDDTIHGDAGKDDIKGDAGDDHLLGDEGRDVLFGGTGNDTLNGGDSDDQLYGQDGDDSLHGDDGDDALHGGPGTDLLDGGAGRNVLQQD